MMPSDDAAGDDQISCSLIIQHELTMMSCIPKGTKDLDPNTTQTPRYRALFLVARLLPCKTNGLEKAAMSTLTERKKQRE